jgi:selenocysteine-specific elongation factor
MIEALPEIKLPEEIERRVNCLIARWEQAGINPPEVKEAIIHCRIPEDKFEEYAAYLTKKGQWIRVGDYFFALAALEKAKDTLKQLLLEKGQASVAEARDLWQTSRKYAVPILEYFDSIKFTRREDLVRKLF